PVTRTDLSRIPVTKASCDRSRHCKAPNVIITLSQAIELHLRAMRAKGCTKRSMDAFGDECAHYLADWMERPLASLRRHEVAERHEALTETSGPYLANRVLHQFRAVYNSAVRRFEDLPPTNPVIAVTFNRVRRRRQPIPWTNLPAWRRKVDGIANPIRRDLQLFLLFTGLRNHDARTVRWEHVDLASGTVHRPRPKGGEDRAFTVPLAPFALEVLQRRRADNPHRFPDDDGWVFPARHRDGSVTHVIEAKENRTIAGRHVAFLPSPHRLRDTFASAAHEARIHPLDLKVLLNHALPATDDVTEGYIRPSVEHLRGCVGEVAQFLLKRMLTIGVDDRAELDD
ncbi:MAG: integrase, partial [Gammaproteobacteria bacterium]